MRVYLKGVGEILDVKRSKCEPAALSQGFMDGMELILSTLSEVSKDEKQDKSVRRCALRLVNKYRYNAPILLAKYLIHLEDYDEMDDRNNQGGIPVCTSKDMVNSRK